MSATVNRQIILKSRPDGAVSEDNFDLKTGPAPRPGDGQVLVRLIYLSLDPYMRGRMMDRKSYIPPFAIGQVLQGGAVGEVVESRHPGFAAGDLVTGMMGWEEFSCIDGPGLTKIPDRGVPLSYWLGVLGMPGLTAWVGLLDVGRPKEGETVFVSAASGAVGSIVGQIAKIKGCRAVGTAGSDDKVAWLTDTLGFDAAFNYRTGNLHRVLAETCPDGIDVNFENVGGPMLEAVLPHMNDFGRIAFCGAISEYNDKTPRPGPRGLLLTVARRLRIEGFVVSDHLARFPEFIADMGPWLKEGQIKYRQTIVDGIDAAPKAFIGLFQGENFGKLIVRVGKE